MKNNTIFFPLVAGALTFGAVGCQDLVDDLNDDPNNFTSVTLDLSLNQAALAMGSPSNQHCARIATMFADQFTGTNLQYISINSYSVNGADFDPVWEDIYQRGLTAAQISKQKANEQGLTALEGAAQIFEAYYFGEAAALFGNVPFTEANNIDQFPNPKYDAQADVLRGAISLLDGAIELVEDRQIGLDLGGILSSNASYASFANALKARYALLLGDYELAQVAAEASGWDNNGANVSILTSTSNYGENLWWQFEVEQRRDYLSVGDSRFRQLLSDTTDVSRGNDKTNDAARYAYFVDVDDPSVNIKYNTRNGFASVDASLEVITAREVQLILAEAAARNGSDTTAINSLNIARNMWEDIPGSSEENYQDYEASDFEEGGIATRDGESSAEALLYSVLEEKYLSVIGLPTYYDILRTNNLIGVGIKDPTVTTVPQRYLYPSTERSSNGSLKDPEGNPIALPGLFDRLPIYQ